MRARSIAALILACASGSAARAEDLATRDTLLVDAAAVPDPGTVRLSAGAGGSVASGAANEGPVGVANVGAAVQVSLLPGLALGFSGYLDAGQLTPSANVRYQFLNQRDHGLNGAALLRYKSVGFVPSAAEAEAEIALGRRLGRLDLVGNGVLGKGLRGDTGADAEGHLSAGVILGESGRIAADARVQAELEDGANEAGARVGRDFELMAGPTASMVIQRVQLQAFVGWSLPKHTSTSGPAALGLISIDF